MPEGQDALFCIELSASVIGTWFLNGTQLQEDDRYSMRRTRTHQSLRIQGVRETDNGAEITFIAYGIRDSAALYIQGMYGLICLRQTQVYSVVCLCFIWKLVGQMFKVYSGLINQYEANIVLSQNT